MKSICYLALFLVSQSMASVAPYFSIRSQSENAARELVGAGWNTNINVCHEETWNGVFSIIPEYSKTFRPYYISRALFGPQFCYPPCPECTNACNLCKNDNLSGIRITGSQADCRGPGDWLADYFGLPPDYVGCISFEPYIENFLVDIGFYLGLDAWLKGLYFKIHAPIVHTRWDLNCCECMQEAIEGCGRYEKKGEAPYWPGYFSSSMVTQTIGIPRDNLTFSFETFMCECDTMSDSNIVFTPISAARICCKRLAKSGLSDIQMALGWNVLCNDCCHLGLNMRASAPTGNRPEGRFLFEPIVGNGKHWELGAGLSSHWCFWTRCACTCNEKESLTLFFDANITHLFKTKQCRTFDLCNKPLSRYMLAAKFGTPVNNLQAGPEIGQLEIPTKQFQGIYAPLANLTTFAVDVSVGVQADVVAMLQYCNGNCSCDFGYNFWMKSCEKIELNCGCPCPFEQDSWALKGDAFMYGFTFDATTTLAQPGIPLSATQSNATICKGANNWPNGFDGATWPQNPGIDNKQLAWDGNNNPLIIYDALQSATAQVYTSKDPVFINLCSLDLNSVRTKGMSHKIFAHFGYAWNNCQEAVPYIGIGGEVEFGHHYDRSCADQASCCSSCAVSQWGIWLKGGVAFE